MHRLDLENFDILIENPKGLKFNLEKRELGVSTFYNFLNLVVLSGSMTSKQENPPQGKTNTSELNIRALYSATNLFIS